MTLIVSIESNDFRKSGNLLTEMFGMFDVLESAFGRIFAALAFLLRAITLVSIRLLVMRKVNLQRPELISTFRGRSLDNEMDDLLQKDLSAFV